MINNTGGNSFIEADFSVWRKLSSTADKMAQVGVYQDVVVISPILSLRVAANTQIKFIVTPAKKQIGITKVTINRAA